MRTRHEVEAELDSVELELRALMEDVRDADKEVNIDEARARKDELSKRKAQLVKELAECGRPSDGGGESEQSPLFRAADWLKAAAEKRTLTIGGTGAINQIKTLFKEIGETDDILNAASYYYGRDASTNIPVLTPMGEPSDYGEGEKNVKHDEDMNVAVTEIQPKAYASVLPITAEMLMMGGVNLEGELPGIFAKAFRRVMHKGMLTGSGENKLMKGLFVSAAGNAAGITRLAAGRTAIKLSELAALALTLAGRDERYEIIMNPSVYQGILSDSTAGEDVKLYKESLIRDKSIEGCRIRLDAQAPSATAAGSILAVAAPLPRYAIGVAGQLQIKPIDVVGDTNTYYQAVMFFSGRQVSDKDLLSIAVAE